MLVDEAVSLLRPRPDGVYVDCTIGLGGHAAALLDAGAGRVIGIDRDRAALAHTADRLGNAEGRLELVHGDFRELPRILADRGLQAIDGAIADLGVSSLQLDDAARGFSFRHDGPLDMRMDQTTGPTLGEIVDGADDATLADVIARFGEERRARRIAQAILRARASGQASRTGELATVVRRAVAAGGWRRIDPATRTFQALRIWVNQELEGLDAFLEAAVDALKTGGRLVVIAFHSLEDRIVKQTLRRLGESRRVIVLTRKPAVPGDAERRRNPRARSARLRAAEKLA